MGKRPRKDSVKESAKKAKVKEDNEVILKPTISSDEPPLKQVWTTHCFS